jgi:uncharacterized membrane protein YoaK (UPF0700 family)
MMKAGERDALLLLLAAGSGSADGWSFFGLGHAFVANMTGNTVLLGVSVFHIGPGMLHPLIALTAYVTGTAAGTLLSRNVQPGAPWAKAISWTLFAEALLLIVAEVAWIASGFHPQPRTADTLLCVLALAIGMQSGAMVQLNIPGVVTTYITGTWTTLSNGITLLLSRQPRVVNQEKKFEQRFALQGGVLGAYFLSAVFTGWAFRFSPGLVGALPGVAVLLAAAYGALRI